MADEMAATQMVAYFASGTAQLRGRSVYVQFSNHKELKTDQTHSNAVSGPPAAAWPGLYAPPPMLAHFLVPVGSSRRTVVAERSGQTGGHGQR